ncbi:uncharacterized protein [Diadema antillarum]|uniref:uncharacterized protein n=1 Tax=Diadema antillarum TaxID=105358 RepID=UPI003A83B383
MKEQKDRRSAGVAAEKENKEKKTDRAAAESSGENRAAMESQQAVSASQADRAAAAKGTAANTGRGRGVSAVMEAGDRAALAATRPRIATKSNSSKLTNDNFGTVNSRLDRLEGLLCQFMEALPSKREGVAGMGHAQPDRHLDRGDSGSDSASASTSSVSADYDLAHAEEMDIEDDDMVHALSAGHSSELESCVDRAEAQTVPAFAAKFAVASDIGQPLDEELASSVNYLMSHHLEEKVLDETSSKYPVPSNCRGIDTPKMNQTIWDNLSAPVRTKDVKLQRVQKSLTRGISAYVSLLDPSNISPEQQDVLALLCNANFEMNALRKELIKPDLNTKFTHLCKPTNPVTKYLFGDDLGKQVKDLQDQHKAAAGVMRGGFKRPKPAYHPYPSQGSQRRYKEAGWVSRTSYADSSGSTSRPFLGQRNQWRKRTPQAPHTFTPTASREGRQAPQYRKLGQGQGRMK